MTGAELRAIAIQRYGQRSWQANLADYLARDPGTIRRLTLKPTVPNTVARKVELLSAEIRGRDLLA